MPTNGGASALGATSLDYNFNNVAGTYLLCIIGQGGNGNANITAVTYNTVSILPTDVSIDQGGGGASSQFYDLQAPPTGSKTVHIAATNLVDLMSGCISFTGVDAKKPIKQTATNKDDTGTTANPNVTLTGTISTSIIVDNATWGTIDGETTGQKTTWVRTLNSGTHGSNSWSSYARGNGASVTMSYLVQSPDTWGIAAVELQPTADISESSGNADVLFDAYGPIRYAQGTAFQGNAFQENAFQVLGGQNGGPFTYNESDTASALAQDALATIQIHNTPVDTASALAQDALATAQAMNASLSESALAQDALAAIQIHTASDTPSALAQEQLATTQVMLASESESATAAEIFATAQIVLASLSGTALAQDVALGALQIPITLSEQSLADVLFDAQVVSPAGGNTYNEEISAGALAKDSIDAGLQIGSGIEAKIGGAGTGTSIFIFDD